MPEPKDTQHDLVPGPESTKDRGVPEGIGEADAKGQPSDDRSQSEAAGEKK